MATYNLITLAIFSSLKLFSITAQAQQNTGANSATSPTSLRCGDRPNTCIGGQLHGHPSDSATEHRWTCYDSNQKTRCHKLRSEDGNDDNLGRCGNIVNTCSGGDYNSHPTDTDRKVIWTCRNRGTYYMMKDGRLRHSGEIRCAEFNGEVRAVDSAPTSATPSGTTPSGTTPSGTTPSGTTPSGTTPSGNFQPATFTWDQVTYLRQGGLDNKDISQWGETSRITEFSFNKFRMCIEHSMKNSWPVTYTNEHGNGMYGNPWVFVPMNGNIYAATFENFLHKDYHYGHGVGQTCKNLNRKGIQGILSGIGPHVKIEPLKSWMPNREISSALPPRTLPGRERNNILRERTGIVWYQVPDYNNGNTGGGVVGYTTNGVYTPASSN